MNRDTRTTIRAVGITLASVVIVVALYLISVNFTWGDHKRVRIHFDYIGNVNTGTTVRKSGIRIGLVDKLEINPEDQRSVFVTVKLASGQVARTDDQWTIVARGILGDVNIEVFPGPIDSPIVSEGHLFEGIPMFDINRILMESAGIIQHVEDTTRALTDIMVTNREAINETIQNIRVISGDARQVMIRIRDATEAVPNIQKSLTGAASSLAAGIERLSGQADGFVKGLDRNVDQTSADIAVTLKAIEEAAGELTKLIETVSRREGVIGRLQDPRVSEDLVNTIRNLQGVSDNLLETTRTIREGVDSLFGEGPPRSR